MRKVFLFLSTFFILSVFILVCPTYASTNELPELPTFNYTNSRYVVTLTNNKYRLIYWGSNTVDLDNLKIYTSTSSSSIMLNSKFINDSAPIYFAYYDYISSDSTWKHMGSFNTDADGEANIFIATTSQSDFILESNTDIYTSFESDEVFFPVAPPQYPLVVEIMKEEIQETGAEVKKTMMKLVAFLIGLLVSLMVLRTLSRVLSVFRVKS